MENVRNRINYKVVSSKEKAQGIRNTLLRFTILNENLVGVHQCKQQVKLNKPIFIGQNVLDQSKYLMYDFHYNTMLKNFDRQTKHWYFIYRYRFIVLSYQKRGSI